jgi:glycosyltransferase involved in cell wall biosynthesis
VREFSVVLPIFNCADTIVECLASLESQTLLPTEVLIVDDGSTDNSSSTIEEYQKHSNLNIRLIRNEGNQGICFSLNRAVNLAKCDWVARMDADDICHVERFEKQFSYIDLKGIDICGSYIELFSENRQLNKVTYPNTHKGIRNSLIFSCPMAHPTVIFNKKKLPKTPYDPNFEGIEDLALWIECAQKKDITFGNVPEILLSYRVSSSQYSKIIAGASNDNRTLELRGRIWRHLDKIYKLEDIENYISFLHDTRLELSDSLSIRRLKHYSLTTFENYRVGILAWLRIVTFAGLPIYVWSNVKKIL